MALLWGGLSLSALGDQLYAVALAWTAVDVFGAGAGYLNALQAFVALVAVLGVGAWADRRDQQRSMIEADLGRALILAAVVVLWSIAGAPDAAELIVAIVVLAVGQAVFRPALQFLLPSLVVDARQLPAANALLDATDRSARLVGPGVVALLAGLIPMVHFFTVDAVSFLLSAAALLLIRRSHRTPPAAGPIMRETTWRSVRRGMHVMMQHPLIRFYFLVAPLISGVWYSAFILVLPLMLVEYGIGGSNAGGLSAYGLILSSYGCTNLASTLVFGSRAMSSRPQFQMVVGNAFTGAGLVLMGLASLLPAGWQLPGYAAAAALGAIGGPMKDIPIAVLRQTRLAAADVGAGMRAYMAVSSAGTLVAMIAAPTLVHLVGTVALIVLGGVVYVGVGVAGLMTHADWVEPEMGHAA